MDGKVCHFVLARNVIILAEWWTTDFLECNELRTVHSKWVEVLLEYYSSIPTPIATFIDVQNVGAIEQDVNITAYRPSNESNHIIYLYRLDDGSVMLCTVSSSNGYSRVTGLLKRIHKQIIAKEIIPLISIPHILSHIVPEINSCLVSFNQNDGKSSSENTPLITTLLTEVNSRPVSPKNSPITLINGSVTTLALFFGIFLVFSFFIYLMI